MKISLTRHVDGSWTGIVPSVFLIAEDMDDTEENNMNGALQLVNLQVASVSIYTWKYF
jgi:hypothetical protein